MFASGLPLASAARSSENARATLLTCGNRPQSSGRRKPGPITICMRLSIAHTSAPAEAATSSRSTDPATPDLGFLTQDPQAARSFFAAVDRITVDNPVPLGRL